MCIYSPIPHTLSYCALIGKCALIRSNAVISNLAFMNNYANLKSRWLQFETGALMSFVDHGPLFSSPVRVQRAIVVTLTTASALASHFKVLRQYFYIMGKALSGELFYTGTGLV